MTKRITSFTLERNGTAVLLPAMKFLYLTNDGNEVRVFGETPSGRDQDYHNGSNVYLLREGAIVPETAYYIGSTTVRNGSFATVYHAYQEEELN